jgi:hypothetical protein
MDPVLSALQQKTVWDGWLGAEIRANYFADLRQRYERTQRAATWLTLIASSGAFLALMGEWVPPNRAWMRPACAALAAAISLWALVAQYPRRVTECADLFARWSRLSNQYQALWDNMYAEDARAQLAALVDLEADISKASNAFPARPRLLLKWQDYVELHHASHPS